LASDLKVGDFNGDSKLDIVINDYAQIVVLPGTGGGTFGKATTTTLPQNSNEGILLTGDFNKDGKLDIVLSVIMPNAAGTELVLLTGNGDCTFNPPIPITSNAGYAVAGDFNGDRVLDLAVADGQAGLLTIYFNDGEGKFTPVDTGFPTGGDGAIAAADLNNDGKLDLIAVAYSSGDVYAFLGNGDGTVRGPFHSVTTTLSVNQLAPALADLNGDLTPDLMICAGLGSKWMFLVLTGNGDGTFSQSRAYAATPGDSQVIPADVNLDGHPDLVTSARASFSVFLNNGDGTFGPEILFNSYGAPNGNNLIVADVNGDSKPDIITDDLYLSVSLNLNTSSSGIYDRPIFTPASVVSAADFVSSPSVGSLATVFGVNFTSTQGVTLAPEAAVWPYQIAGTSLTVDGIPAPISAIANVNGQQQINFQVPWELAFSTAAQIVVTNNGRSSEPINVPIRDVRSFFVIDGYAAALHIADYTLVTPSNPAIPGEAVAFYATGLGQVYPADPATDTLAPVLPLTAQQAVIFCPSAGFEVLFTGLAPGLIGVYQINAIVPAVPSGTIQIQFGTGYVGPPVNFPIQ
jgi:uncharacterized protein (TIGR03437 family)